MKKIVFTFGLIFIFMITHAQDENIEKNEVLTVNNCVLNSDQIVVAKDQVYFNNKLYRKLIVRERNLLQIRVDQEGKSFINNKEIDPNNFKEILIAFLDNGGAVSSKGQACTYCKGERSEFSSDNPDKAFISIFNYGSTKSEITTMMSISSQLMEAYNHLWNRIYGEVQGGDIFDVKDCATVNSFKNEYYPMNIIYNNGYSAKQYKADVSQSGFIILKNDDEVEEALIKE